MKFPILLLFSALPMLSKAQTSNDSLVVRLIHEGDVLMEKKNYLAAKRSYEKACMLDSTRCPTVKIKDAAHLLGTDGGHCGDVDQQYRKILVKAAGYYDQKNYVKALEYYKRAITLKPTDPFVQERIRLINTLL